LKLASFVRAKVQKMMARFQSSNKAILRFPLIGVCLCCAAFSENGKSSGSGIPVTILPPKLYAHCRMDGSQMAFVLRWEYDFFGPSAEVSGFRIYRRIEGADYTLHASIPRNGEGENTTTYQEMPSRCVYSYTDKEVQSGVEYSYKVVAFDSAGNEGFNEVHLQTDAEAEAIAGPRNVLIVVNRLSPESVGIGDYYRRRRNIPPENLLSLSYRGDSEIVGQKTFEEQIREPLRAHLASNGLKKKILYIVMTYGLPYKVYVRGGKAADSVDGYLTDPFDEWKNDPNLEMDPNNARYRNPYYLAGSHFSRANGNKGYLVTRLDGPLAQPGDPHYNKDTIHGDDPLQYLKNTVDYALWAEQNAASLSGKGYFDRRYREPWKLAAGRGDLYVNGAYDCCRSLGFPAVLDTNPQLFGSKPTKSGGSDPLLCDNALWYAGWYSHFYQDVFAWQKGAVGFHIESWTARYLRSESKSGGRSDWLWVPGMIRAGITATMGPVHEPGLGGVPQIDWFFRYFLQGYSFAEAAYMANYSAAGQMVMIGDPLYRPFPSRSPDRTPPAITITSPTSGQTVRGTEVFVEGMLNDPAISMLDDARPVKDQRFSYLWSIGTFEKNEADLAIVVRATDTSGNRTSKAVTVHWVNGPPDLEPIEPMTVREGDTLSFKVAATDPDGDDLSYSFTVVGRPQRGTSLDRKTGEFKWRPDFDQAGKYEFVFRATDGFASDKKQVTITVQQAGSHPPKFLIGSRKLTAKVGGAAYLELKAEDLDEDALTFSSVSPLPQGASIAQSPPKYASFFWKPAPDQVGLHKITFKVSDGKGGEDTVSVEIEVVPAGAEENR
jgi:uncharacterized protein (TIGR03790 family)